VCELKGRGKMEEKGEGDRAATKRRGEEKKGRGKEKRVGWMREKEGEIKKIRKGRKKGNERCGLVSGVWSYKIVSDHIRLF
jgi:hypothetical protein